MNSRCRGCGAEVEWIKTAANRRKTPVDAEPVRVWVVPGGDTFLRKNGTVVFGRKVGDAFDNQEAEIVEAHESHFATCPVGGQFRNRQPRTRGPGYG